MMTRILLETLARVVVGKESFGQTGACRKPFAAALVVVCITTVSIGSSGVAPFPNDSLPRLLHGEQTTQQKQGAKKKNRDSIIVVLACVV
jgi:hypothetical protein